MDGAYPSGSLVQGKDGSFYGTAINGGSNACGTVFKISAGGAFTLLFTFYTNLNGVAVGGAVPTTGLVQGSDGYFYGTTYWGGTNVVNYGTVFRVSSTGAFASLYSFTGGADGGNPSSALIQGSDGNFYGTTTQAAGTNSGSGTFFKITPTGALTTLYTFTGGAGGLIQGTDGNFDGTMGNLVFRLSTVLSGLAPSILIPMDAAFGFNNGVFGFDVSAPPGSAVIIQASRDLRTWTAVQTNSIGSAPLYFSDPQPAANNQRFYRAVLR